MREKEEEDTPHPKEFSSGDRSVVVLDNGGLRVIIPRPELTGDKYFVDSTEGEEEDSQEEEENGAWGDGTRVEMSNGNIGELFSREAIMYGDLNVDVELREVDFNNLSCDASTEEEEEEEFRGGEDTPVVASSNASLEN